MVLSLASNLGPGLRLEGLLLASVPGFEAQVLVPALGLDCQVLGLVIGLEGQVLVLSMAWNTRVLVSIAIINQWLKRLTLK